MISAQLLGVTSAEYAKFMSLPKEEQDKIMQAFVNAISNKQQATDTLKAEINKRP
jgi:hypothetical protein